MLAGVGVRFDFDSDSDSDSDSDFDFDSDVLCSAGFRPRAFMQVTCSRV